MPSGSALSSLNMKKKGTDSNYKSGWYFNSEYINYGSKKRQLLEV